VMRRQTRERWHGELRRAKKDDAHTRRLIPLAGFLQLLDLAPDDIPLERA
jgi:hypothetical protein